MVAGGTVTAIIPELMTVTGLAPGAARVFRIRSAGHANFTAVVDIRRARQGELQGLHHAPGGLLRKLGCDAGNVVIVDQHRRLEHGFYPGIADHTPRTRRRKSPEAMPGTMLHKVKFVL